MGKNTDHWTKVVKQIHAMWKFTLIYFIGMVTLYPDKRVRKTTNDSRFESNNERINLVSAEWSITWCTDRILAYCMLHSCSVSSLIIKKHFIICLSGWRDHWQLWRTPSLDGLPRQQFIGSPQAADSLPTDKLTAK